MVDQDKLDIINSVAIDRSIQFHTIFEGENHHTDYLLANLCSPKIYSHYKSYVVIEQSTSYGSKTAFIVLNMYTYHSIAYSWQEVCMIVF